MIFERKWTALPWMALVSATAAVGVMARAGLGDVPKTPIAQTSPGGVPVSCELEEPAEILFIVPDGSRVLQGDLLCSLDPAGLDERLAEQTNVVKTARAELQSARSNRELAEMELAQYKDVTYKQAQQAARGQVALAEGERNRAQAQLKRSEGLIKKRYITIAQYNLDRNRHQKAIFLLEQAQSKLKLLERFTYAKEVKERESQVEKTRADELAKEQLWTLEKSKQAKIELQIKNCRIYAPVSGRVVYAQPQGTGKTGATDRVAVGELVRWRQTLFRITAAENANKAGPEPKRK